VAFGGTAGDGKRRDSRRHRIHDHVTVSVAGPLPSSIFPLGSVLTAMAALSNQSDEWNVCGEIDEEFMIK
jgi:hypothetical protein